LAKVQIIKVSAGRFQAMRANPDHSTTSPKRLGADTNLKKNPFGILVLQ